MTAGIALLPWQLFNTFLRWPHLFKYILSPYASLSLAICLFQKSMEQTHTDTQPYKQAMSAAWGLPARSTSTTKRKRQWEHERWAYFRERGSWSERSLIPHFNFSGETGTRRGAGNLAGKEKKGHKRSRAVRCKTEGQAAVMFDSRALLREGGGTAAAALKPGQGNTRTISGGV